MVKTTYNVYFFNEKMFSVGFLVEKSPFCMLNFQKEELIFLKRKIPLKNTLKCGKIYLLLK